MLLAWKWCFLSCIGGSSNAVLGEGGKRTYIPLDNGALLPTYVICRLCFRCADCFRCARLIPLHLCRRRLFGAPGHLDSLSAMTRHNSTCFVLAFTDCAPCCSPDIATQPEHRSFHYRAARSESF